MYLQRYKYLDGIIHSKVVSVVRGDNKEDAFKIADACIKGGVATIELTYTTPNANDVIKKLVSTYGNNSKVLIGAGTVLDPMAARMAISCGAKFIVSPSFNSEVAKICNLYSIPYVPGCMTPKDIQLALSYGADMVKIFPGSVVKKEMIKAILGPFPNVGIMITGGVNLNNITEWLDNGALVIGAGSDLTSMSSGDGYEEITKRAKQYREKINKYGYLERSHEEKKDFDSFDIEPIINN